MSDPKVALAALGYVGIEAPDPLAWRRFATEVCGLAPSGSLPGARPGGAVPGGAPVPAPEAGGVAADGTLHLKLDRRQWRLAVHPADRSRLAYLGFELRSPADFDRAVESVSRHGVPVHAAGEIERTARGVDRLAVLHDPAGHRLELFQGPLVDGAFRSPTGTEFVTGTLGMGHAVLYVPDAAAALAFYRDVLGFRRTDYMVFGPGGQGIHFLRCNARHHSLALLQVGPLTGLQHVMFETTSLDAVGGALDRALAAGIEISSGLGRHRNDRTVSFYMRGPSGFDVEIGWDALLVGDDWVEHELAGGGDEWGHHGLDAAALKPRS